MKILSEYQSKQLLAQHGFPVNKTILALSLEQALEAAAQLGYPVVLKLHSETITHKSDLGGVKLGIQDQIQLKQAFQELIRIPGAQGVTVQEMLPPGLELMLGLKRDPIFGHALSLGLGGILTELLQDFSVRIVPVTEQDAAQMISELRCSQLLDGYRGFQPVSKPKLIQLILMLSQLAQQLPSILELDLNPVMGYRDRLMIADARIVLEG